MFSINANFAFILNKLLFFRGQPNKDVRDWEAVNQQYSQRFSNILGVIDLILTMSPSSAEAERGFSQLKLLKTNLRSKMNQQTLNHCLGIKLLAPNVKTFDPTEAIQRWNSSGVRSRRPTLKDKHRTHEHPYSYVVVDEPQTATQAEPLFEDAAEQTVTQTETLPEEAIEASAGTEHDAHPYHYDSDNENDSLDSAYDSDSDIPDSDMDEETVNVKLFPFTEE